jgi:hypothetical protein
MNFDQRKISIARLALFVFLLATMSVSLVPAASAQATAQGGEWREDKGPGKRERHRLRREEHQELAVVRELDREHRIRFRMNNQSKAVGYFDNFGTLHYYGYYDSWGFFHRY